MTTSRSARILRTVMVILLALTVGTPAFAHDHGCSLSALHGLYVFSATGFVTPSGVAAVPKAIVELIRFNGDGTVTTPAVTLTVDSQAPLALSPGAPGTYTVADLAPRDAACLGTLTFSGGNTFNLVFPHDGEPRIWLIQTNPNPGNVGNVLQGAAVKIAH